MDPDRALHLAQLVLGIHYLVASFVIFGMIAVPLGAIRGWSFVCGFPWRATHLGVAFVIALQKVAGATCFLSVWEFNLLDEAGKAAARMPPVQSWAIDVMHWNMPLWFFTVLYVAVLGYIVLLWIWVPPQRIESMHRVLPQR